MSEGGFGLHDGMDLAGLTQEQIWLRYCALGGNLTQREVGQHIRSEQCRDRHEHNLIAQAINEAFLERGQDHPVAYQQLDAPNIETDG